MTRDRWDLAVAGASFAGLSCAEAAARRGMRVVVIERKRCPGSGVHTTGLLTREALAALRPPPGVLGERLDAIDLCAREGRATRCARAEAGFVGTDTAELLRALASRATAAGAELRLGTALHGVTSSRDGLAVATSAGTLSASFLAGCDGARSRAARSAGLPAPARVLAGAERHLELAPGHGLDEAACLLLLDAQIAPGYAAWCVRGVHGAWQVGVLGEPGRGWRPDAALDAMLAWLLRARGARVLAVIETRGGVVPAGGALPAPWSSCGRIVLAGDAAGHVSALTAGGIGRAALAGGALGASLGVPGDAWKHVFRGLSRASGGWRLAAATGLSMAVRFGAPLAVAASRVGLLRESAAALAFRASAYGEAERTGEVAGELNGT